MDKYAISKTKKIGLISLGCDKNRVDSEKALAIVNENAVITNDISNAEVIIINSCAFLESARREAINTVIECNEYRKTGKLEKIVLTGCLPEKFIDELFEEFTEVDVFLGYKDYDLLFEALELSYVSGQRVNFVKKLQNFTKNKRILTTPCHYYYLKIADGCNNKCTYCLIPKIRGKYFSTPIEELVKEVENLGYVKELILVAQDVTRYGIDLYGKPMLVELIKQLSSLDYVESIRLLYCYPDMITDDLIEEISANDKVIKYLDIPLQHSASNVLKRMNRKGNSQTYLALINKLRDKIPNVSLRSTFIAGFPGETEEDFNELVNFIKLAKFTNCGFFAYSREEGTPAYKLPNQIDEDVKQKRVKKLYSVQRNICKKTQKNYVGKTLTVLCDGVDYEKQSFYGRAYFSAPDIDGKVYFCSDDVINQGEYYDVYIENFDEYDLYGRVTNELT